MRVAKGSDSKQVALEGLAQGKTSRLEQVESRYW